VACRGPCTEAPHIAPPCVRACPPATYSPERRSGCNRSLQPYDTVQVSQSCAGVARAHRVPAAAGALQSCQGSTAAVLTGQRAAKRMRANANGPAGDVHAHSRNRFAEKKRRKKEDAGKLPAGLTAGRGGLAPGPQRRAEGERTAGDVALPRASMTRTPQRHCTNARRACVSAACGENRARVRMCSACERATRRVSRMGPCPPSCTTAPERRRRRLPRPRAGLCRGRDCALFRLLIFLVCRARVGNSSPTDDGGARGDVEHSCGKTVRRVDCGRSPCLGPAAHSAPAPPPTSLPEFVPADTGTAAKPR
jgi:hypothetical protein